MQKKIVELSKNTNSNFPQFRFAYLTFKTRSLLKNCLFCSFTQLTQLPTIHHRCLFHANSTSLRFGSERPEKDVISWNNLFTFFPAHDFDPRLSGSECGVCLEIYQTWLNNNNSFTGHSFRLLFRQMLGCRRTAVCRRRKALRVYIELTAEKIQSERFMSSVLLLFLRQPDFSATSKKSSTATFAATRVSKKQKKSIWKFFVSFTKSEYLRSLQFGLAG